MAKRVKKSGTKKKTRKGKRPAAKAMAGLRAYHAYIKSQKRAGKTFKQALSAWRAKKGSSPKSSKKSSKKGYRKAARSASELSFKRDLVKQLQAVGLSLAEAKKKANEEILKAVAAGAFGPVSGLDPATAAKIKEKTAERLKKVREAKEKVEEAADRRALAARKARAEKAAKKAEKEAKKLQKNWEDTIRAKKALDREKARLDSLV